MCVCVCVSELHDLRPCICAIALCIRADQHTCTHQTRTYAAFAHLFAFCICAAVQQKPKAAIAPPSFLDRGMCTLHQPLRALTTVIFCLLQSLCYTHRHTQIHARTHTHTHTDTCTHTQTQTQTHTLSLSLPLPPLPVESPPPDRPSFAH